MYALHLHASSLSRRFRSADSSLYHPLVTAPAHTLPVIVGPTAGGKSSLAVALAHALTSRGTPAEILSADAYQVYRRLDIGTAKPTIAEREGIPHHLIDIVEPTERFTLNDWLSRAEQQIDDCRARNVIPIVVGGTHLYIKSLLEGLFEGPGADEALRAELRAIGPAALRAELERVDPQAAARIHPNDERRTIRAIEVFRLTGTPISAHQQQWDQPDAPGSSRVRPDAILIGLDWPTELINPRINARVKDMISRGLVDEVRSLHLPSDQPGISLLGPTAREALGYKQLIAHLDGHASLESAIEEIKIETRRFAKNQRTWLRRLRTTPRSIWIDASAGTDVNAWVERLVESVPRA